MTLRWLLAGLLVLGCWCSIGWIADEDAVAGERSPSDDDDGDDDDEEDDDAADDDEEDDDAADDDSAADDETPSGCSCEAESRGGGIVFALLPLLALSPGVARGRRRT